jgi:large subunit ribosomal protein L24
MHIRKNDLVEVTRGEEQGKRGKVLKIKYDKKHRLTRVLVDGLNMVKRHRRMTKQGQPAGIMDTPQPISIANVVLLCPKCGNKAKVKSEVHEGRRVRVCKLSECGEVMDKV